MKVSASTLPQWSYRMALISRTIAAILGGYGVACLAAAGLAVNLPMSRSDAVMAEQMLSFVVYTFTVLWVFATHTAWRAWSGLIGLSEVFGLMFAWGRWLVCIAAMFMLVAIVNGVITHKKIFTDFFTFRSKKGEQRA